MSAPAPEPVEPILEDQWILPVAQRLSECLCTELERSPGGTPCFCGVVPGANVAMDFCDCTGTPCGMAYVRIHEVYPSRRFPQPSPDLNNCNDPLAVTFEIGITRCLPGMDDQGEPPDAVAQFEAVRIQTGDMAAIRRTVVCCFDGKAILGRWRGLGPAGNCGGGVWPVTVPLMRAEPLPSPFSTVV